MEKMTAAHGHGHGTKSGGGGWMERDSAAADAMMASLLEEVHFVWPIIMLQWLLSCDSRCCAAVLLLLSLPPLLLTTTSTHHISTSTLMVHFVPSQEEVTKRQQDKKKKKKKPGKKKAGPVGEDIGQDAGKTAAAVSLASELGGTTSKESAAAAPGEKRKHAKAPKPTAESVAASLPPEEPKEQEDGAQGQADDPEVAS